MRKFILIIVGYFLICSVILGLKSLEKKMIPKIVEVEKPIIQEKIIERVQYKPLDNNLFTVENCDRDDFINFNFEYNKDYAYEKIDMVFKLVPKVVVWRRYQENGREIHGDLYFLTEK